MQPRFAWVSAERVLRWRRLGDGGDGDGDASGSARLADYAEVEAGGDVRRSRRSSMGGALDSCALTLIPAGEDRPLTLQFDAGNAAASTALRDDDSRRSGRPSSSRRCSRGRLFNARATTSDKYDQGRVGRAARSRPSSTRRLIDLQRSQIITKVQRTPHRTPKLEEVPLERLAVDLPGRQGGDLERLVDQGVSRAAARPEEAFSTLLLTYGSAIITSAATHRPVPFQRVVPQLRHDATYCIRPGTRRSSALPASPDLRRP